MQWKYLFKKWTTTWSVVIIFYVNNKLYIKYLNLACEDIKAETWPLSKYSISVPFQSKSKFKIQIISFSFDNSDSLVSFQLRRVVRPKFLGSTSIKMFYDALTTVCSLLLINFASIQLCLLSFERNYVLYKWVN